MVFLNIEDEVFPCQSDFRCDATTTVAPFPNMQFQHCRVLEFFSGGYGGWHCAGKILSEFCQADIQTVGIDNDLDACRNYCLSREVALISGDKPLPIGFFQQLGKDCVIHGDISSRHWLPAIVHWRPQIACISAPCQPWSRAGLQQGLSSHNGIHFTEAISACRFIQPAFILLEQVAGFISHPHRKWVIRTCVAAGYKQVWAKVVDLSSVCPTQRPRWIALFQHASLPEVTSEGFQTFPNHLPPSPVSFDAVLSSGQLHDPRLVLSSHAYRILSSVDFLPPAKRRQIRQPVTPQKVLLERCTSVFAVTPTFLATYGFQHELDETQLRDKGCLTHLVKESSGRIRHWHPAEICMLHLGFGQHFIHFDWKQAYKHLGNQIAIGHALLALVNAYNFLHFQQTPIVLQEVIDFATKHRITASNSRIVSCAYGSFIAKTDLIPAATCDNFRSAVDQLFAFGSAMPADSLWTFQGTQQISQVGQVGSPISPVPTDHESDAHDVQVNIAFIPKVPLRLHCQQLATFWVSTDVTPDYLVALWDSSFTLKINHLGLFDMIPHSDIPHELCNLKQDFLVSQVDSRLTILPSLADKFEEQVQTIFGNDVVFDQFGRVQRDVRPIAATLLTQTELKHQTAQVDPPTLLAALQQVKIVTEYLSFTGCIKHSCIGDPVASQVVINLLAHSFEGETLKQLGRSCHVKQQMIVFEPSYAADPVPPAVFRVAQVVSLTRSITDRLQCEDGVSLRVKWLGRTLFHGLFHGDLSTSTLQAFLSAIFTIIDPDETVALVHKGVRLGATLIRDLQSSTATTHVTLHLVRSMHGGGNKHQQRVQVKNSIAGTLIEQGIDLQWILTHLDKIMDAKGFQKLIPIAALPAGQNRSKQIAELFTEAGFPLPTTAAKNAPSTLQAKLRKKTPSMPAPSNITIEPSFLLNQDGTQVPQIYEFRAQRTGIYVVTPTDAQPWIREGNVLSADELGMLVIGEPDIPCSLPHDSIHIPCTDSQGHAFLLAATLVQFGAKKVKVKALDAHIATGTQCKVTSLTMWRQEWSSEEWEAAISQTYQFVKDAFSIDNLSDAIVACWGRSLRRGKSLATNHDATSIQLHCSVSSGHFHSFLSKTGFNRIWAAPKQEDGRLSESFRILWLSGDLQRVTALAAHLSGCTGLVKGKSSMGLRFTLDSFAAAWKHENLSQDVPEYIPSTHVFKLEPLPFGCSPQQLADWSAHVGWKFRPLRATGPKAWLVCSGSLPPNTTLAFNGNPILVRHLPPRSSQASHAIVAGPRHFANKPSSNQTTSSSVPFTPADPWAQWKGPRLTPSAAPSAGNRALEGPAEKRFQQQDDRIAGLEDQIKQISLQQDKQDLAITQVGKDVMATESRLSNQLSQAIDSVKVDLKHSLQETLQAQHTKFDASISELRQLLTSANKRKVEQPDDMTL